MECEKSIITDEMFTAVKEGQIKKVKEIIDKYGLSYSLDWEEGYKLLLNALENRHLEIAKILITGGCAVNKEFERSILDICILHDDIEILEMILKRGDSINISIQLKKSKSFKQVIKRLLKYGADVNGVYPTSTLLHQAVDKNCLESIEYLLNKGANINGVCTWHTEKGITPLHIAARNDYEEVVQLLLSKGANVDAKAKNEMTPLLIATSKCYSLPDEKALNTTCSLVKTQERQKIQQQHYEERASLKRRAKIVKLLLEAGADVNCTSNDNSTPLLIAIENRNEILVKQILQRFPDINNESNKCCLQLAMKGVYNKDIVESLLEYGFSVQPEDAIDAKLHDSVKYGHLRVIEDLLKYGANINVLCEYGFTPLHTAAEYKQKEAAELLIQYGANINAKAINGETPISVASRKKNLDIVNIFLKHNARTENETDLLFLAVQACSKEIIETLLQRGFDVNASNWKLGFTALHYTAHFSFGHNHSDASRAEIAELLINKGANVNAKDHNGITTLHYACLNNFHKLIETLLYCGADINITDSLNCTPLESAFNEFFEDYDYYLCSKIKVLDALLCHTLKIKMANLFLNEKHLDIMKEVLVTLQNEDWPKIDGMQFFVRYNFLEDKFKQEIARMKNKTFENSSISLYEILVNDTKILAKYMDQENIVQELKSDNYKSEFPIYARMIEINFIKGMDRKKLFDDAKHNFHFVFKSFDEKCANKILDLLCTSDLQNLKDAFSLPNSL